MRKAVCYCNKCNYNFVIDFDIVGTSLNGFASMLNKIECPTCRCHSTVSIDNIYDSTKPKKKSELSKEELKKDGKE